MAGESTKSIEALVLGDADGNLYAIPRDTLDRYRLTEEQKAAVAKELGDDDVSGFLLSGLSSASSTSASSLSASSQSASSSEAYSDQASSTSASGLLSGSFFSLNTSVFNPNNEIT